MTRDLAVRLGLGCVIDPEPGDENKVGWVSVPYTTPNGVNEIKYRCAAGHDCKAVKCQRWLGTSGAGTYLYGVMDLHLDTTVVCIAEGETDKWALNADGLAAVGVPGGSKWMPHWRYVFEGFERVVVFQDPDEQGKKFVAKVTNALQGAEVVELGADPSDYLSQHGLGSLRKRVLGNDR